MRLRLVAASAVLGLTALTGGTAVGQAPTTLPALPTPAHQPGNPACTTGSACPPTPLPASIPVAPPGLSRADVGGTGAAAGTPAPVVMPAPPARANRAAVTFTG